MEPRLYVR